MRATSGVGPILTPGVSSEPSIEEMRIACSITLTGPPPFAHRHPQMELTSTGSLRLPNNPEGVPPRIPNRESHDQICRLDNEPIRFGKSPDRGDLISKNALQLALSDTRITSPTDLSAPRQARWTHRSGAVS